MEITSNVLTFLAPCLLLLLCSSALDTEIPEDNRYIFRMANPVVTLQALEELTALLRSELSNEVENKRNFDGGYGSRYVAAHSVGSKLMALKQAADWNGPGRKKRQVNETLPRSPKAVKQTADWNGPGR